MQPALEHTTDHLYSVFVLILVLVFGFFFIIFRIIRNLCSNDILTM